MPSDPDFYNIAYTTAACPKCLGPEACEPRDWARGGLQHITLGDALRCRRCRTDYAYEFLRRVADGGENVGERLGRLGSVQELALENSERLDGLRDLLEGTERDVSSLLTIARAMQEKLEAHEERLTALEGDEMPLSSRDREYVGDLGGRREEVADKYLACPDCRGALYRLGSEGDAGPGTLAVCSECAWRGVLYADEATAEAAPEGFSPVEETLTKNGFCPQCARPIGHLQDVDLEDVGSVRDYLTLCVFGHGPLEGVRTRVFLLAFVQSLLLDTRGETLDGQRTQHEILVGALDDLASYLRESRHGPQSASEYLHPGESDEEE